MISLAITSYNRFDFTINCFEQVLNSDLVSEVVIVDDCSDDGSYEKLINFYSLEPKVKIFRNEHNLGCAFNKRRAVELVSCEFVAVIDSDNIIDESYIDTIFDYDWNEDIIFQPEWLMPYFDFRAYSGLSLTRNNIAQWIRQPLVETLLNAHNFFVNKKNYLEVSQGLEDAVTSDSILFALKWLESGRTIFVCPELRYWHSVHPKSHYRTENHRTPIGLHESILNKLKALR